VTCCEAAVITTRYFQDDDCWIADCEICLVPMVVWTTHADSPPEDVKFRLHSALTVVADAESVRVTGPTTTTCATSPTTTTHTPGRPTFWRRGQAR